jgi:hypothetical protein
MYKCVLTSYLENWASKSHVGAAYIIPGKTGTDTVPGSCSVKGTEKE